jgi:poly(hydroxyalkanoate) depolymerase family esterase
MTNRLHRDMLEATRLTRAGRLGEATAFLQRALGRAPMPDAAASASAQRAPVIDAAPERTEPSDRVSGLSGALRRVLARFKGSAPDAAMPPPGPASEADGGRFLEDVYRNEFGSRAYKLYVPSAYRGEALPLVVMLHGCTQSPDDFAAGTRMNALAEEHGVLVAYPAQAKSANASKCWNWFKPSDQQRGRGEPALIAGITRHVMSAYAVDAQRVYVAGLSAGGAKAAIMGAAYPDLYAAIGVHSGLACGAAHDVPSAFAAMRQGGRLVHRIPDADGGRIVPTIVFHGDRDTTVHPGNGDLVIAQSPASGDSTLRTEVEHGQAPGGHGYRRTRQLDAGGRVLLEQWVVLGAGHAWSGGSPAGTYTDARGPDASQAMLRFFLSHRHPGAAPA